MNVLLLDLRYTLRALARNPGFTVVALLSLALGIGANTAIFTLMDRVLIRALPLRNSQELVVFKADDPRMGSVSTNYNSDFTFSYPLYRDFRDRAPGLNGVAAWFSVDASFSVKGQTDLLTAHLVSGNFFDVLGVRTALGRPFSPEDDRAPGVSPVVVLTHAFWVRRFNADPNILNQSVIINGHPMTVVGITVPGFSGVMLGDTPAFFVPLMMESQMMPGRNELENRRASWLTIMARLQPGVSASKEEAALNAFWKPLLQDEAAAISGFSPNTRDRFLKRHLWVLPGAHGLSGMRDRLRTPLMLLMGLVGFVLLIACANVASLMLARAASRQKEIAIRLALGARRSRIIRQVMTESATISLGGGLLGLLLSVWTSNGLLHILPFDGIDDAISTDPDIRVLAFTAAVAIASGILFGLAPALQAARPALAPLLKDQASNLTGGGGQVRSRKALVVAQVALSLLLLVGAGLFMRSVQRLKSIDPGFRIDHLISFSVNPSLNGYDETRGLALYERLLRDLAAIPGVRATTIAQTPLIEGTNWYSGITVPGHEKRESDPSPNADTVGPGYFATLGTPLVSGREFTAADGKSAPPVAIVNEAFVHTYFDDRDPIGRQFYFSREKTNPVQVVGVVRDAKYARLVEEKQVFVFSPYSQRYRNGSMTFYVRTVQDPESIGTALRKMVRDADPDLPLFGMKTMNQQIDESVFSQRIISELSAFFGLVATLLAAIGLYGVMSFAVTRRTREIGIRMALGADRRNVMRLMLGEAVVLVGIGIAIALPAAFPLTWAVRSLLYGVGPHDPIVIVVAVALLAAVALVAALIPSRRATRIDPISALRND